ncbi:MAG: 2-oxoglutarate dehydrogenase complex dihydrolipoyllysine-residue succinyltransferase [Bacteroidales bacterium]|nr:2-oxoglutarate dehydrogenase complex dihydrolipoyllysine-residue succinyltransferase [Bacteroidales bacterium]MBN2819821.1 2-oxoglutarate dehydrogenase complex dihydrolipoyllysine-residue succinyltransferase [Bacteroidales bacterium]
MILEIKIPSPGESITEVEVAQWLVEDGSYVQKDQEIGEIESDKATLPIIAGKAGKLKILIQEGTTAAVGDVACSIDTEAEAPVQDKKVEPKTEKVSSRETQPAQAAKEPVSGTSDNSNYPEAKITPVAKKMMEQNHINVDDIINGLKKISSKEVVQVLSQKSGPSTMQTEAQERAVNREKMTSLRRKISERLVAVKNETAMLTTFNEVDMSAVMELRNKYQKQFVEKHGIKLGFMSFFTKAASLALQSFPKINSYIDGDEIVSPNYNDIGIAVQTGKGLMVPIVRDANKLSLAEIELEIAELAKKARAFRISPEEMSGGTFTITNGGVFGSMLSTPIINPPQSGILGMHNIVERPVAIDRQVVIRPIMYLALSYDHRIVDGRDSVSFLVKIKELIEAPYKILIPAGDSDKQLLGL